MKCLACASPRLEPGRVNTKGVAAVVFTPDDASSWKRRFMLGVALKAVMCLDCGHVQLAGDPEALANLISGHHTRCRKCRHILRGLSQPRCPECGEPI